MSAPYTVRFEVRVECSVTVDSFAAVQDAQAYADMAGRIVRKSVESLEANGFSQTTKPRIRRIAELGEMRDRAVYEPPLRLIPDAESGMAIIAAVSEAWAVRRESILSNDKRRTVAEARQVVMYLLRQRGWELAQIGALLGREHSTVSHGVANLTTRLRVDKWLREMVHELKGQVAA